MSLYAHDREILGKLTQSSLPSVIDISIRKVSGRNKPRYIPYPSTSEFKSRSQTPVYERMDEVSDSSIQLNLCLDALSLKPSELRSQGLPMTGYFACDRVTSETHRMGKASEIKHRQTLRGRSSRAHGLSVETTIHKKPRRGSSGCGTPYLTSDSEDDDSTSDSSSGAGTPLLGFDTDFPPSWWAKDVEQAQYQLASLSLDSNHHGGIHSPHSDSFLCLRKPFLPPCLGRRPQSV